MENIDANSEDFKFKCTKCGKTKPNIEFYRVRRSNIIRQYTSRCKCCLSKQSDWAKNNKEARKIIANRWSNKNKDYKKSARVDYRKSRPINYMVSTAKGNAKNRNITFNITVEDVIEILDKQNTKCFYTNKDLRLESGFSNSMSIDRYDSSIGYEKDNIVLCQYKVNIMKNNATILELIEFCEAILNNKEQIINKLDRK